LPDVDVKATFTAVSGAPSVDESRLRRLAFIKALYGLGRRQSEDRGALSVAAVLTFHDAVELWLYLAAENVNAALGKKQDLMQYWEVLGEKLGQPLPGKQSMERLTKARVGLKHYGIRPSTADVHDLREATASFLQEATSLVFRLSFTGLSAIDLVADPQIAGFLREASDALDEGAVPPALDALAKAFHCLREYLSDTVVRIPGREPVWMRRVSPPRTRGAIRSDYDVQRFEEYTESNLAELRDRVSMLELGVDMSRFRRFSAFVPGVMRTMDGKLHIQRGQGRPALEATDAEARDCFDFILDTAAGLGDHMEPPANDATGGSP